MARAITNQRKIFNTVLAWGIGLLIFCHGHRGPSGLSGL